MKKTMQLIGRVRRCPEKERELGQSLVEFALSATVLILLLAGILDLGRLYYIYVGMYNAAEEGALYFCNYPACKEVPGGISPCDDSKNATYRLNTKVKAECWIGTQPPSRFHLHKGD